MFPGPWASRLCKLRGNRSRNDVSSIVTTALAVRKNGVASLAYVPGTHVFLWLKVVDGRDNPGHDDPNKIMSLCY
jgi:hypothetical protein